MTEVQIAGRTLKVLTREERRQQFIESGWWVPVQYNTIPVHWLYEGEQRLDGGYYTAEVAAALRAIRDSNLEIKLIAQVTEPIYYPGRFKRIYAKNKENGTAFLTASAMLHFRPTSTEFLANNTDAVEVCKVQPGWILVTRSGSVGRCVFVGKRLSKFSLTDDALRVQASEVPAGYLYAYLSSWIGQALISKDQYGSAINHLEPHHLSSVPVPLLPENVQQEIHDEIIRAYSLRDKANELLDKADELLHSELGLPRFDESLVPYLPVPARPKTSRPAMPHPKAFSIKVSALNERLDASYHVPVARTAVNLMEKGKYGIIQLDKLSKNIFMPPTYKRIYVAKQYGEPILSGSHLVQSQLHDLRFISPKAFRRPSIETYRVEKGWVLVTGRGTTGRTALVSNGWHRWLASHNLLRIVPSYSLNSGYLQAFLMSSYGTCQMEAKNIGAVVNVLTPEDLAMIYIPNAPKDIQTKIGNLVSSAFEKKDEANAIEEATILKLEDMLQRR